MLNLHRVPFRTELETPIVLHIRLKENENKHNNTPSIMHRIICIDHRIVLFGRAGGHLSMLTRVVGRVAT